MSWFVAGIAAERSGVVHTLHRVSGRKAAALRSFYRAHTKTDRIDAPVLARMKQVDDALHEFTLPTAGELALKRLVTYRQRLQKESLRTVSRVRSLLHWADRGALHDLAGGIIEDAKERVAVTEVHTRDLPTCHMLVHGHPQLLGPPTRNPR